MTLSRDRLLVRLFFLFGALKLEDKDRQAWTIRYMHDGTNLCHLMRVALFWLPLKLLLWAALAAAALYTGWLVLAALFFGVLGWAFGALLLDGLAILVLTIVTLFRVVRAVNEWEKSLPPAPPGPPSSLAILGEWVRAKKRRICPLVEFR